MGSPVVARSRREIEIDLLGLSAEELTAFIAFAQVVEKNRANFIIASRRANGKSSVWMSDDLFQARAALSVTEKALEAAIAFENSIRERIDSE